jgi:hypothetical protein
MTWQIFACTCFHETQATWTFSCASSWMQWAVIARANLYWFVSYLSSSIYIRHKRNPLSLLSLWNLRCHHIFINFKGRRWTLYSFDIPHLKHPHSFPEWPILILPSYLSRFISLPGGFLPLRFPSQHFLFFSYSHMLAGYPTNLMFLDLIDQKLRVDDSGYLSQ